MRSAMQTTDSSTTKKPRRSRTAGSAKGKAKTKSSAPKYPPPAALSDDEIGGFAPVDFRPLKPVKVVDSSELAGIIARARHAQETWGARSLTERVGALRRVAKRMLDKRDEILEILRDEIGKLEGDALMSEALGPLDQVNGWAKVLKKELSRHRVSLNPIAFPKKKAYYDLVPRGVIGIIAPWNYPLATYFRSVFPALMSGNAVVLKPPSQAPRCALWVAEQIRPEVPENLFTVVPGRGAIGSAIIEAGIDGCIFTGSVTIGAEVQLRCAERGIPVSAEMGGNDPAIILGDCDLDRTVAGVTHWALHNVGQACGAIEIALVDEGIAGLFVDRLRRAWTQLRVGPGPYGEVDISPVANREQLELVDAHVRDAVKKGATLVCGGRATGDGLFYEPTLLDYCTEEMEVVKEETFGPVLAVVRVGGVDRAIEIANRSRYGLTASIWSSDLERAERLTARLDYGVVTVNNHSITGAIPQLPWSGTRATGFGVANSPLALHTFVRPRAVLIDRATAPEPFWLPFDRNLLELGNLLADVQLGRINRAWRLPFVLSKRIKRIRKFFS